jgi:hypothetical protein
MVRRGISIVGLLLAVACSSGSSVSSYGTLGTVSPAAASPTPSPPATLATSAPSASPCHTDGAGDESPLPAARSSAALAYDPATRTVFMLGGVTATSFGDPEPLTWQWNGDSWSHSTSSGCLQRLVGSVVYDQAAGELVLARFGDGNTYVWSGGDWQPRGKGLYSDSFAYDPHTQKLVSIAIGAEGSFLTWTGHAEDWTFMGSEPGKPDKAASMYLVYDPPTDRLLLITDDNGEDPAVVTMKSWAWDGQSWNFVGSQTEPPVLGAAAATDTPKGALLYASDGNAGRLLPVVRSRMEQTRRGVATVPHRGLADIRPRASRRCHVRRHDWRRLHIGNLDLRRSVLDRGRNRLGRPDITNPSVSV